MDLDAQQQKKDDREYRSKLVLWKKPIHTLLYFVKECGHYVSKGLSAFSLSSYIAAAMLVVLLSFGIEHLNLYMENVVENVTWYLWWVFLGFISSAGFGFGYPTFMVFLGPHIAKVTVASFNCLSTNFPSPPYPDEIICPEERGDYMSVWAVVAKVRLEALMWGVGTAIGELPPYFLARSTPVEPVPGDSDDSDDDEAVMEVQSTFSLLNTRSQDQTLKVRIIKAVKRFVDRMGFVGILLAASIPNPLFDLAGIICGMYQVPFATFFLATLIGKSVVKMHLQMLTVVYLFVDVHFNSVVDKFSYFPYVGEEIIEFLKKQKESLHCYGEGCLTEEGGSVVSTVVNGFVMALTAYFVVSIVHMMAQKNVARAQREARRKKSS